MPKDLSSMTGDEFISHVEASLARFKQTLSQPDAPEALSLGDWTEHLAVFLEFDEESLPVQEDFWKPEEDSDA